MTEPTVAEIIARVEMLHPVARDCDCPTCRHNAEVRAIIASHKALAKVLEKVRERIYDCKHNAMFSDKGIIVRYVAELLPDIDAVVKAAGVK